MILCRGCDSDVANASGQDGASSVLAGMSYRRRGMCPFLPYGVPQWRPSVPQNRPSGAFLRPHCPIAAVVYTHHFSSSPWAVTATCSVGLRPRKERSLKATREG